LGEGHLNGWCFSFSRRGIHDTHFTDVAQFIEQVGNRAINSFSVQLSAKKTAKHEGEDAARDVHFDFLVGPVILGTQRNVAAVLHVAEGGFYVMLTSIASDDLHIRPLVVVREEDCLAEQGFFQVFPCSVVEAVRQIREAFGFGNLHFEQQFQERGRRYD
jgi:hypothetical protein